MGWLFGALVWSLLSPQAVYADPIEKRQFPGTSTVFDISGAMGPNSYIEFNNLAASIFSRTGTLVDTSSTFMNVGPAMTQGDPQILWDPATGRFYYGVMAVDINTGTRGLAWGFSTTSNPRNLTTGFCHYWYPWEQGLDFEKMGGSRDFLLITFSNVDIMWISKPPPGTTCPAGGSFLHGLIQTPGALNPMAAPAVEVDPSGTGWLIGIRGGQLPGVIGLVPVRRNARTGGARLGTAILLSIPDWTPPPQGAPQRGTHGLIDLHSLSYWTQAVAAVDPRIGRMAIWMQWTAGGGAGSEILWYEVAPTGTRTSHVPVVVQSGVVASPDLWVFSGSISPDRAVNGDTRAYGSNMVLGFLTSSAATYPAVRMVSKTGDNPQSGIVLVKESDGPATGYCESGLCRYTDYTTAASPDPLVGQDPFSGAVWLANHLEQNSQDQTWIWKAAP